MDQVRTGELRLQAQLPFEFKPVAPPANIADLVNSFYAIRTDAGELDEIVPAYSAQLLLFVRGRAVLRPQGSRDYPTATVTCSTPLLHAMPVTFEGPSWILGASLTALGWQALSELPANEVNGKLIDGGELLGKGELTELEALGDECRSGASSPEAVFEQMGALMRSRRERLDPSHVRIVEQIMDWLASGLSPPIADLYREAEVSDRTVQRVTRRYFGVSPSHLVKRVRAIRAAMLLANPDLPQAMREKIIDAYYDQAHLIRDIRRYTGRTPTRLAPGTTFEDTLDPQAHGRAARMLSERGE
ncbi:MAG: helix-turn-helix domain-containing protein [Erythrobacter sp.]